MSESSWTNCASQLPPDGDIIAMYHPNEIGNRVKKSIGHILKGVFKMGYQRPLNWSWMLYTEENWNKHKDE